jgi:hypothetical protein
MLRLIAALLNCLLTSHCLAEDGEIAALFTAQSVASSLGGDQPAQVGWYLAYVQSANKVWLFAINLAITDAHQLSLRHDPLMQALRAKYIID